MKRFLVTYQPLDDPREYDHPLIWMISVSRRDWERLNKSVVGCPVYFYQPDEITPAEFWPKPASQFKIFESVQVA